MKNAKNGARHPGRTALLALVVLVNLCALPGYSLPAGSATVAQKSKGALKVRGAQKDGGRNARSSGQNAAKPDDEAAEQRGRIAFASDRDGDFEIYVMDADGGGQRRLTDDPAEDTSPTWSPDGERLAFVSTRDGNAEIYVMDAAGGSLARLTDDPAADLDPAWSPDGARIAFTSARDNTDEIYVMSADGGDPTNLTNNREGDDVQPAWSPSGASLAFASNRDENFEIYVMNADGGNQRNLSNNPATDSNPAWSPMRITFQSDRDSLPNAPETNFEIYTMNGADGGNQMRLTAVADDPATPLDESFDVQPARSSDGARIVFASTRDGDFEIYTAGADGSNLVKFTDNDEANDIEPAVQPLETAAAQGSLQFSAASFSVAEGGGSITVTVTRTGNTSEAASVGFATNSGTASDRSDFIAALGTLTFAPGETSRALIVLIVDDSFAEFDETFSLTLANPTGAALGTQSNATLTIADNDAAPSATNPIDDPTFFVRQQYLDFLNREPDQAGLNFWIGQLNARIAQCPAAPPDARARCVLRARADISTAFFLSIEFQETGFFIIRLYQEAFGRLPTLREFLEDAQKVREGVVIGQSGARERIEANRREFLTGFVNRDIFRARFDGVSNADFVNALFANAGVAGSAEADTRAALINGLNTGAESRATVLLRVADTGAVFNAVYNRAFVLMEYFGYLRRDPDPAGFAFWLNKLNNASLPGEDVRDASVALARIRRAEMVEAFIDSTEYRSRFGQP